MVLVTPEPAYYIIINIYFQYLLVDLIFIIFLYFNLFIIKVISVTVSIINLF